MAAVGGCQRAPAEPCEKPRPEDERCRIVRRGDARGATTPPTAAATEIPNLPLDALSPEQRALFFSVVDDQFDPCGKPRSFGETLRGHQAECPAALELARFVVARVQEGGERAAIVHALIAELRRVHHKVAFRLDGRPRRGPAQARATVVTFSDFQCPYCREVAPQLTRLLARFPDVALVFKQCPLESHAGSDEAARAAVAAHRQGRFWEMHDALFRRGAALDAAALEAAAREAGLDLTRFAADRKDAAVDRMVQEDLEDADRAEIEGTPSFWVDGVEVPFDRLEETLLRNSTVKEVQ